MKGLVLILGLCACVLAMRTAPVQHVQANEWNDTLDHFNALQGAAQALKEGQFPLREIPGVMLRLPPVFKRYAIFQFYGGFSMALGGGLVLAGMNPWHAFLALVLLAGLGGFWGLFRLARDLGAGGVEAAAAAVLYTLAPYHLLALSFKGALPELIVLGILPWIFLATLRACREPRPGTLALNVLVWALMMHCHHVYHAWTLPFLAAFLILEKIFVPAPGFRLWPALAAYLGGLALSLWFVWPGVIMGPHFSSLIPPLAGVPGFAPNLWYDLKTLLAHAWILPWLGLDKEDHNVYHVGWPLLAGVAIAIYRQRGQAWKRPALWLFLASFLLVWEPLDYWRWLGPLQMIQARFRLLVYVILFGSLAAAGALKGLRGARGKAAVILLLVLLAWLHAPYQEAEALPCGLEEFSASVERQGVLLDHSPYVYLPSASEAAQMDKQGDLRFSGGPPLRGRNLEPGLDVLSPGAFPRARMESGLWTRASFTGVEKGSLALLPSPWYPGLYCLNINGKKSEYGRVGNRLAMRLPEGASEVSYRFTGCAWANWVSLAAWVLMFGWLCLRLIRGRWMLALLLACATQVPRGLAADESFEYAARGARLASSIMEFSEAERCWNLASDCAKGGGEKAQALAGAAQARLDQGETHGVEARIKSARAEASRGKDPRAWLAVELASSDLAQRRGRWQEAQLANTRAWAAAGADPSLAAQYQDRLCFQQAGIINGQNGPVQAGAFLEKNWMPWAFRPDHLFALSREDLGRAVLVMLDLKRVDRAFILAAIYTERANLVADPCPEPVLKAEAGTADICSRFGRAKASRVFYESAAARSQRLFGPADPGACRFRRMAGRAHDGERP